MYKVAYLFKDGYSEVNNLINIRASDARRSQKGVHRHHHYEVLIIKRGTGQHTVDFETFDVKQVYFAPRTDA